MRRIAVVTFGRSDYNTCSPLLGAIASDAELELHLVVAGMHLSPEFGLTVKAIEADGFDIRDRVEMLLSSDTPAGAAKSVGIGLVAFADLFARSRPDLVVLVGDRLELLSACTAALPHKIPLAHIGGGGT